MNRSSRRRGAVLTLAGLFALALAGIGCEDDTTPVITKLSATPQCGEMVAVPVEGVPDSFTYYLDVSFFGRASSGNALSDPTGGNSALTWRWYVSEAGQPRPSSPFATDVVTPTRRFTEPGDYDVVLEVEDDDGDKDSRSIRLELRASSSELPLLSVEAEVQSTLRTTPTGAVNTGLDDEGEVIPIEELPLDERFVVNSQAQLQGWNAIFDGKLETGCTVAEVFSQFDWTWQYTDGVDTTTVTDLNPISIRRSLGDYDVLQARVFVSELVTDVADTSEALITYPTGVIVRNGQYFTTAPGATESIELIGAFLYGVSEISFGIEFVPSELTLLSVDTSGPLADAGFTIDVQQTDNRVDLTFSNSTPLADPDPEIVLATLDFETADMALADPTLRPMRVRDLVVSRGDLTPPTQSIDGFVRADVADCNENGLGDTMELAARGTFIDITLEGEIDYCGDCDEDDTKDGVQIDDDPLLDIDSNGLIDTCDCDSDGSYDAVELSGGSAAQLDSDGDGVLDTCDCDWNGLIDLEEIRNGPNFVPTYDPETGRVVSYTSDLDVKFGGADLTLDICQDCDQNDELDVEQFTLLSSDRFFPDEILRKAQLDIDRNGLLDSCDCNGNSRLDRGEEMRGDLVDDNGDGVYDSCDCDGNGEPDLAQIAATLTYDDLDVQLPQSDRDPVKVNGYSSSIDVDGNGVIDSCEAAARARAASAEGRAIPVRTVRSERR